ncbi:hypothetical protein AKJ16_DCAP13749 [Drosera capensis]
MNKSRMRGESSFANSCQGRFALNTPWLACENWKGTRFLYLKLVACKQSRRSFQRLTNGKVWCHMDRIEGEIGVLPQDLLSIVHIATLALDYEDGYDLHRGNVPQQRIKPTYPAKISDNTSSQIGMVTTDELFLNKATNTMWKDMLQHAVPLPDN